MAELVITTENFEAEVLQSTIPVLVDFWAPWCGPCRMLAPTVEKFAQENEGKIKVGKVNVDDEGPLAERFGISSIPTLIVFKNGEAVKTSVGLCSKSQLEAMVD